MNDEIKSMNVIRAYKFRLYPNSKCQSEINLQLRLSKDFYNKLLEKAKEAYGKDKSFKPKRSARNTLKTCSNCGNITDMPLSAREYNCDRCGLRLDRDINASINILNRATFGQRESHAQGENRQYIPTGNANGLKELRTDKTDPLQDAVIA